MQQQLTTIMQKLGECTCFSQFVKSYKSVGLMRELKKFSMLIFLFVVVFGNYSFGQAKNKAKSEYHIKKIVIDAGHGGHDPGCTGKKLKEKDITLALTLKLGAYIEKNLKDIEVIYTRKTDKFVELYKRAKIANDNNADLFISIHINANPSPKPYGLETYVMGLHKSQDNLEVAIKENAAILMEDNYSAQYGGYDPNSPEAHIIFSLYQNAFLEQSLFLASKIQENVTSEVKFVDRGVKQAGFLVLYKTIMPGILVEAGFLSNAADEKLLMDDKNLDKIAYSIYKAFVIYRNYIEKNEVSNTNIDFNNTIHPIKLDTTNKTDTNIQNIPNIIDNANSSNSAVNKDNGSANTNANIPIINNKTTVVDNPNSVKAEVYFSVQFKTSNVKKDISSAEFVGLEQVHMYYHQGLYKYLVGKEYSLDSAVVLQKKMNAKGYKDAFVVAFKDGQRITPQEALNYLKQKK